MLDVDNSNYIFDLRYLKKKSETLGRNFIHDAFDYQLNSKMFFLNNISGPKRVLGKIN